MNARGVSLMKYVLPGMTQGYNDPIAPRILEEFINAAKEKKG